VKAKQAALGAGVNEPSEQEELCTWGSEPTLNFRKFKVALNPMYRIFLNFAKSCILSCLSKFDTNKKFTVPVLKYVLKAELRVFLAGHSVALVTYCVLKMIPTYSPVIGLFFDTMIVASNEKEW